MQKTNIFPFNSTFQSERLNFQPPTAAFTEAWWQLKSCTSFKNPLFALTETFIYSLFSNRHSQRVPHRDAFSVVLTQLQPSSSSRRVISHRVGRVAPLWLRVELHYCHHHTFRQQIKQTGLFCPKWREPPLAAAHFFTQRNWSDKVQTKPLQQLHSVLRFVESAAQASVRHVVSQNRNATFWRAEQNILPETIWPG